MGGLIREASDMQRIGKEASSGAKPKDGGAGDGGGGSGRKAKE